MEEQNRNNRTGETPQQPDEKREQENTVDTNRDEKTKKDDVGLTSTQLHKIQRHGIHSSGSHTKPFITGTDSDGQL